MSEPSPEKETSSLDVAHDMTRLVTEVVFAVTNHRASERPDKILAMLGDISTPEGARLAEAEARLAVTLEEWLGTAHQYLLASVVAGLSEPLMARLGDLHADLHRRP